MKIEWVLMLGEHPVYRTCSAVFHQYFVKTKHPEQTLLVRNSYKVIEILPTETKITTETQEQSTSTCKPLKREFHSLQIVTTFSQQFKN